MLDANVVIEAHHLQVWNELIARAHVACPATVVHREALFYRQDKHSVPPSIRLDRLVAEGRIAILEATADDLGQVAAVLTADVHEGLDPGETEALAILLGGKAPGHLLCTGDWAAIRALALLGLSERGISLESVLNALGLRKPLKRPYTEEFFQAALREGTEHRLWGLGVRNAHGGPPP